MGEKTPRRITEKGNLKARDNARERERERESEREKRERERERREREREREQEGPRHDHATCVACGTSIKRDYTLPALRIVRPHIRKRSRIVCLHAPSIWAVVAAIARMQCNTYV